MSPEARESPAVSSVTGGIDASALGITLYHEHLACDISVHSGRRDNVLDDPAHVRACRLRIQPPVALQGRQARRRRPPS